MTSEMTTLCCIHSTLAFKHFGFKSFVFMNTSVIRAESVSRAQIRDQFHITAPYNKCHNLVNDTQWSFVDFLSDVIVYFHTKCHTSGQYLMLLLWYWHKLPSWTVHLNTMIHVIRHLVSMPHSCNTYIRGKQNLCYHLLWNVEILCNFLISVTHH